MHDDADRPPVRRAWAAVIALNPADYHRQPWKNGGGVSELIASAHEPGAAAAWQGLAWSFSRTGFQGPSAFSDLSGFERIQLLASGRGLRLRALDSGPDIPLTPGIPVRFDGGRRLEGAPDGPVEVVNLMGRTGRVTLAMTLAGPGDGPRRFDGGTVLVHAPFGPVLLRAGTDRHELGKGWTLRADEAEVGIEVLEGRALVATIGAVAR